MLLQKSFVGIRKRRSAAIKSEEKKIQIKHERREHALAEISATIELDKKEAILVKLKVEEDMEDLDELAELEKKMVGNNIDSSGSPPLNPKIVRHFIASHSRLLTTLTQRYTHSSLPPTLEDPPFHPPLRSPLCPPLCYSLRPLTYIRIRTIQMLGGGRVASYCGVVVWHHIASYCGGFAWHSHLGMMVGCVVVK
jgi:hypothetical protein